MLYLLHNSRTLTTSLYALNQILTCSTSFSINCLSPWAKYAMLMNAIALNSVLMIKLLRASEQPRRSLPSSTLARRDFVGSLGEAREVSVRTASSNWSRGRRIDTSLARLSLWMYTYTCKTARRCTGVRLSRSPKAATRTLSLVPALPNSRSSFWWVKSSTYLTQCELRESSAFSPTERGVLSSPCVYVGGIRMCTQYIIQVHILSRVDLLLILYITQTI